MGQAFDRDGSVLGEAYGNTKSEVFEKLNREFKDAAEIRIKTLEASAQGDGDPGQIAKGEPTETSEAPAPSDPGDESEK